MARPRRRTALYQAVAAFSLVLALVAACACEVSQVPSVPSRPAKTVIGYYRTSNRAVLDHTGIEYQYLTHIAHAFAWPDAAGNLVVPSGFLYPELNAAAHAAGVKMIVSLGGWGNCAGFPGMASTAGNRARFIGQLIDFCKAHAYDGVDLDWEFVSNETEKADFILFVEALGAALKAQSPQLLLTAAVPSDDYYGRWIDYARLADDFDFIGFMTYDYHGAWSDHSGHNSPLTPPSWDGCGSVDGTFLYCSSAWPSSAGPSTAAVWACRSRPARGGTTARSWTCPRPAGPASGTARPRSRTSAGRTAAWSSPTTT
jgi:hypothetical protein